MTHGSSACILQKLQDWQFWNWIEIRIFTTLVCLLRAMRCSELVINELDTVCQVAEVDLVRWLLPPGAAARVCAGTARASPEDGKRGRCLATFLIFTSVRDAEM